METPDKILEWIIDYCSGNISEKEKEMLENWVNSSPLHADEFRKSVKNYHRTAITTRWEQIEGNKQRIREAIHASNKKKKHTLRKIFSAAAAIVLLLGISYILLHNTQPDSDPQIVKNNSLRAEPGKTMAILELASGEKIQLKAGEEKKLQTTAGVFLIQDSTGKLEYKEQTLPASNTIMYNTITIPEGGEYQMVLSDGTQVWLNSASTLRFPTAFSGKREIFLTGEAYFNVTANPNNPFIVRTSDAAVTVLGTSFNVMAYPEDRRMEVALLKGKVNFTPTNAKDYPLTPGHIIKLEKNNRQVTIEKGDIESITAWRSGIFYFENISLDELFIKLKRWYQIPFIYNNEIGSMRFTGAVTKYRDLEYVLNMVTKTHELKFQRDGNRIIVLKNNY